MQNNNHFFQSIIINRKIKKVFTGSKALALCHGCFTGFFLHSPEHYTQTIYTVSGKKRPP